MGDLDWVFPGALLLLRPSTALPHLQEQLLNSVPHSFSAWSSLLLGQRPIVAFSEAWLQCKEHPASGAYHRPAAPAISKASIHACCIDVTVTEDSSAAPTLLSMQEQPATVVQAWSEARQSWHPAAGASMRQEAAT